MGLVGGLIVGAREEGDSQTHHNDFYKQQVQIEQFHMSSRFGNPLFKSQKAKLRLLNQAGNCN